MTQTYSAASLYGIIDRMNAPAIQQWLAFHTRLKYPPRFLNVFTAARFNEGADVLRQVKNALPATIPVWRGYDGKDAYGNAPAANVEWTDANFYLNLWNERMMSAKMAAGLWFERRVRPYVDVIRETGAVIHLLNEAAMLFNAAFETEQIRLLGEEGIRAGAFAWSAGTPDWPDYQQLALLDQVRMASKYHALVMTHEYAGLKPEEQNSLINRNATLTKLFPADQQPDVFIGEFGLAKARLDPKTNAVLLDSASGWREMDVSVQEYGEFIKATAKTWYLPRKISFSIYSGPDWGKNGSFGVLQSPELLDGLVQNSQWMCFEAEDGMILPRLDMVLPPPQGASAPVTALVRKIPATKRMLRDSANYLGALQGSIQAGDKVRAYSQPLRDGQTSASGVGKWQFGEVMDGNDKVLASGWFWRDGIDWELPPPIEVIPVPVPVPDPPPAPPPITDEETPQPPEPQLVKLSYSWEIETTPERHALIQTAMMTIMNQLMTLGQAMAGQKVTLVTDAA